MKKLIFISVLVAIFSFSFAGAALANGEGLKGVRLDETLNPGGVPVIEYDDNFNPVEATRLELTRRITNVILGLAGVVAVFYIINSAFWLVASAGKEETITQHKKGLMWALIGLILIILSYSIIRFIASLPFQAGQEVPQNSGAAPAAPGGGAPALEETPPPFPLGGEDATPAGELTPASDEASA